MFAPTTSSAVLVSFPSAGRPADLALATGSPGYLDLRHAINRAMQPLKPDSLSSPAAPRRLRSVRRPRRLPPIAVVSIYQAVPEAANAIDYVERRKLPDQSIVWGKQDTFIGNLVDALRQCARTLQSPLAEMTEVSMRLHEAIHARGIARDTETSVLAILRKIDLVIADIISMAQPGVYLRLLSTLLLVVADAIESKQPSIALLEEVLFNTQPVLGRDTAPITARATETKLRGPSGKTGKTEVKSSVQLPAPLPPLPRPPRLPPPPPLPRIRIPRYWMPGPEVQFETLPKALQTELIRTQRERATSATSRAASMPPHQVSYLADSDRFVETLPTEGMCRTRRAPGASCIPNLSAEAEQRIKEYGVPIEQVDLVDSSNPALPRGLVRLPYLNTLARTVGWIKTQQFIKGKTHLYPVEPLQGALDIYRLVTPGYGSRTARLIRINQSGDQVEWQLETRRQLESDSTFGLVLDPHTEQSLQVFRIDPARIDLNPEPEQSGLYLDRPRFRPWLSHQPKSAYLKGRNGVFRVTSDPNRPGVYYTVETAPNQTRMRITINRTHNRYSILLAEEMPAAYGGAPGWQRDSDVSSTLERAGSFLDAISYMERHAELTEPQNQGLTQSLLRALAQFMRYALQRNNRLDLGTQGRLTPEPEIAIDLAEVRKKLSLAYSRKKHYRGGLYWIRKRVFQRQQAFAKIVYTTLSGFVKNNPEMRGKVMAYCGEHAYFALYTLTHGSVHADFKIPKNDLRVIVFRNPNQYNNNHALLLYTPNLRAMEQIDRFTDTEPGTKGQFAALVRDTDNGIWMFDFWGSEKIITPDTELSPQEAAEHTLERLDRNLRQARVPIDVSVTVEVDGRFRHP